MSSEKRTTPLLQISNLSKRFRVATGPFGLSSAYVHAVNDASLTLNAGQTLGLVGESGCGKSTLAKCIMGLEHPTAGSILFQGKNVDNWNGKELRRQMQLIFQDPYSSLNPRQKVGSIIREMLDIHGVGTKQERVRKVESLLSLVGLNPDQASRYPHEFSGGQRQRIAVARALALDPQLVLCDEPVSALDVSVQAQVLNLLKELQTRLGLTYIFISHDLSVVSHISDHVAVMYLGSIVEQADSEKLFEKPLHPYTEALLSAVLRPDPTQTDQHVKLKGDLPNPIDPPQGCPFHPRCPKAMDKCATDRPTVRAMGPTRSVACWLYS